MEHNKSYIVYRISYIGRIIKKTLRRNAFNRRVEENCFLCLSLFTFHLLPFTFISRWRMYVRNIRDL